MEEKGSSQGEGPRRKWTSDVRSTSDVRTSDVEAGPSQGAGREKVGQAVSHPLEIIIITLLSTGQRQPMASACCTHNMINPHNHYYYPHNHYYYPITQMRKPRSREVNWLVQGHPATKWLRRICAQVCLSPQWGPWASGMPKCSRAAH